ncbi:MAG TPA: hypothetical protein VJR89_26535, partial [Polyangiales bacterium]|nr:hypothetical protein [Polyangiales bacterium]
MSGEVRIVGGKPLRGRAVVPAELDVALVSLVLASLASGRSELQALPLESAAGRMVQVLQSLGVGISVTEGIVVDGIGLTGLAMPSGALECGSSLGLSLCAGLISAQRFGTRLLGRSHAHSLDALVGALRARGAHLAASRDGVSIAPLVEGETLLALDCTLERGDPDAKSGVLISALFASGPTLISEPLVSADHLERAFVGLGLPLRRIGSVVAFDPGGWDRVVPPQRCADWPGSADVTASLLAAAQLIGGSDVSLSRAPINPSRSGVLDVMRSWGADLVVAPSGDASLREPIAELRLRTRGLRGGVLGAEELVRSRGAIGALAMLAAASARGVTLYDLDALAPRDSAFWPKLAELLGCFGFTCDLAPDHLRVPARPALRAGRFDAR